MIFESEKVSIFLENEKDAINWLEGQWCLGRHVAYFVMQRYGPCFIVHARISIVYEDVPPVLESFDLPWNP